MANSSQREILILGFFLTLVWSGLRFSDLQRSQLHTWQLDATSLRGLTWRSKTCSTSTPFGIRLQGWLSKGSWTRVHKYLSTLDQLHADSNPEEIDFALPSFGDQASPPAPMQAMPYAEALYMLRYYMQLPWKQQKVDIGLAGSSYTLHGLKATLLSYAVQLNLPEEDRRVHGKHRPANQSVSLYGRDDIAGSLRLQDAIIDSVNKQWRPCTPLARGGQTPLPEPQFTLESSSKFLSFDDWKFFRFLDQQQNGPVPSDEPLDSGLGDDVATSSDSSSSSASSAPSPQVAKRKLSPILASDIPAEHIFGVHRNIWHIMVTLESNDANLPRVEGRPLKTACGRQLQASKLSIQFELALQANDQLCVHWGCRKGFSWVFTSA